MQFTPPPRSAQEMIIQSLPLEFKRTYSKNKMVVKRCPGCGTDKSAFIWVPQKSQYTAKCFKSCSEMSGNLSWILYKYYPDKHEVYKKASKMAVDQMSPLSLLGHKATTTTSHVSNFKPKQVPMVCAGREKIDFDIATPVHDLYEGHPAKEFVISRGPLSFHQRDLYYTHDWYEFAKRYADVPDKFYRMSNEPRLVIPFWGRNQKLLFFQGRVLPGNDSKIKYSTMKVRGLNWEADTPILKVWGLHRVSTSRVLDIPVLEAPLDAMIIKNALGMAGADIDAKDLCHLLGLRDPSQLIFIYDNELWVPSKEQLREEYQGAIPPRIDDRHDVDILRRNSLLKSMWRKIDIGCRVVLWDPEIEPKDVTEMTLSGLSKDIWKEDVYSADHAKEILMESGLGIEDIYKSTREAEKRRKKRRNNA